MAQPPNQPGNRPNNPYSAGQAPIGNRPQHNPAGGKGDSTGGVIPYKNPHALIGYYLGIFGMIPLLGLPFAIAAIILGIIGLKKRKANPVIKGSAHAIVAIVCGTLGLLCGGGILVSLIVPLVARI